MRALKKSVATRIRDALRRDAFRIEPLEPRVLLSADPILAPLKLALIPDRNDIQSLHDAYMAAQESTQPQVSVPLMGRLLSMPAANSPSINFAVDSVLFDAAQLSSMEGFMDSSLRVAANEVLGGSGNLNVSLYNSGTVSPGYSPGLLNVASYTQGANASLLIEIGGEYPATLPSAIPEAPEEANYPLGFYDRINVQSDLGDGAETDGVAYLNGNITIDLINNFVPSDGDQFTIMTYENSDGRFASASGLLQAQDNFYFEISETGNATVGYSLVLTARALNPALGEVLATLIPENQTALGEWLSPPSF
jgi:hypothetical protein